MYHIEATNKFKRDVKRCKKQQKDMKKFKAVSALLENQQPLKPHHRDHVLTGNWSGYKECHIEPDWLLVYRVDDIKKAIVFIRMGSHSELFG